MLGVCKAIHTDKSHLLIIQSVRIEKKRYIFCAVVSKRWLKIKQMSILILFPVLSFLLNFQFIV